MSFVVLDITETSYALGEVFVPIMSLGIACTRVTRKLINILIYMLGCMPFYYSTTTYDIRRITYKKTRMLKVENQY